jgi:hypothetical protein
VRLRAACCWRISATFSAPYAAAAHALPGRGHTPSSGHHHSATVPSRPSRPHRCTLQREHHAAPSSPRPPAACRAVLRALPVPSSTGRGRAAAAPLARQAVAMSCRGRSNRCVPCLSGLSPPLGQVGSRHELSREEQPPAVLPFPLSPCTMSVPSLTSHRPPAPSPGRSSNCTFGLSFWHVLACSFFTTP